MRSPTQILACFIICVAKYDTIFSDCICKDFRITLSLKINATRYLKHVGVQLNEINNSKYQTLTFEKTKLIAAVAFLMDMLVSI